VIPTVLVPITLSFEGKSIQMDAAPDVSRILKSPVFSNFPFSSGKKTQYADALLRATFPKDTAGHTLLGKPVVKPIAISIPVGYGYLLTSKKTGTSFGVVDSEFLQKQLFQQIPRQDGALIVAVTHNTTYYADADATVCCSWGTHGIDAATGNSFVLGSFLRNTPVIVKDQDVQPLTQQLAEFFNDPLHDPKTYLRTVTASGNYFPAWQLPPLASGAVEVPASAPTISFSSPPTPIRKTAFPHRPPSPYAASALPTICRTLPFCPGTSEHPRSPLLSTVFPIPRR
jgi:hypothetical protein